MEETLVWILPAWLLACFAAVMAGHVKLRWGTFAFGAGCVICVIGALAGAGPWGVMDRIYDCSANLATYGGQALLGSVPLALAATALSMVPLQRG